VPGNLSGSPVAAAHAAPISWRTLLDDDSQYSAESTRTLIRLSPLVSSPSGNQVFSGAALSRSDRSVDEVRDVPDLLGVAAHVVTLPRRRRARSRSRNLGTR
jgi:hypothetical protein